MTQKETAQIIEGQNEIIRKLDQLLGILNREEIKYLNTAVLNMAQAAELLGISQDTLLRACMNKELPCRRLGSKYIFIKDALMEWIKSEPETVDVKEYIDTAGRVILLIHFKIVFL